MSYTDAQLREALCTNRAGTVDGPARGVGQGIDFMAFVLQPA
jgi:hypothetical protein